MMRSGNAVKSHSGLIQSEKKRGIASADCKKEKFDYKSIDFSYDFEQCLKASCEFIEISHCETIFSKMLEFVIRDLSTIAISDKC